MAGRSEKGAVVAMLSGGAASYCAAKRVIEGGEPVHLLFCDVGEEDGSTLEAVEASARFLGMPLTKIQDARYPGGVWDLFRSSGMMGKPGAGHCSRILKRETALRWVREFDPMATIALGLSWEEQHRLEGPRRMWAPNSVIYPLVEEPWLTRDQRIETMRADLGFVPELYDMGGFEHANCAGACVKAGQAQWRRLLDVRPEVYQRWEQNEEAFREQVGKDVSILRDRIGGTVKPLTLKRFREEGLTPDLFAPGGAGCGCFTDED